MSTLINKLLTAEDFFDLPEPTDGSRLELVRGEVITMPPTGFEHGEIQARIVFYLMLFLQTTRIGRVVVESGIITEKHPASVRGPDVSYYSAERVPQDQRIVQYAQVSPDLCVEVVSPSNTRKALREKILEYFACGVRMVWLVDPEDRSVTIYREPIEGRVLNEGANLDGGDVLPGFHCPVTDLFQNPK